MGQLDLKEDFAVRSYSVRKQRKVVIENEEVNVITCRLSVKTDK